jgi:hypothetical protein
VRSLLVIPGVTMSQNKYDRLHWAQRHEERNRWFLTVLAVAGRKRPKQDHPCSLSIVRVAKRLLDIPNIASPCKPLIDAMVEYGHLRGDGPNDVVQFTTSQRKPHKNEMECMEVLIDEWI